MTKFLKIACLITVSFFLAQTAASAAFFLRGTIDFTLINRINQNTMANDLALRVFNFLKLLHYGEAIIIIGIVLATFISSLIFNKFLPGSKFKSFVTLTLIWLVIIFLLPLAQSQTSTIK